MEGALRIALGLALGSLALAPLTARADGQVSARYGWGFGSPVGRAERTFLWENTLRMELLFGAPGDEHARVGPALDLRTAEFDSAEASLGLGVLLPVARGYPLTLTAALGWAVRRDPEPDGAIFVGTVGWGYRSYNFHAPYQMGFDLFVSGRMHLDDPRRWEITAGVEIDLEVLVAVPAMFLINLFRRSDPDELEGGPSVATSVDP